MARRATVWIAAVLVLLGIAALAIVATLQRVELRGVLARRLSAATGREVSIKGPVRLQLGLPLGLRFTDLAVGEPTEPSLLRSARVGRLDLVFALWPLLRGELDLCYARPRRTRARYVIVVVPGGLRKEFLRRMPHVGGDSCRSSPTQRASSRDRHFPCT